MSILGVLLLVIILCVFAILLLSDKICEYITSTNSLPENIIQKTQNLCHYMNQPAIKEQSGYIALLFGIWNLFGPNFGSIYGGLPIIGALIPSLVLCFDALILNPELLNWAPISSIRDQIESHVEQYSPIAGWITLATAILHMLLYRLPLF